MRGTLLNNRVHHTLSRATSSKNIQTKHEFYQPPHYTEFPILCFVVLILSTAATTSFYFVCTIIILTRIAVLLEYKANVQYTMYNITFGIECILPNGMESILKSLHFIL